MEMPKIESGRIAAGRIAAGRTEPGQGWQKYGDNGIFIDVDTSSAGFTGIPVYVTSLAGNSHHWETTGGSSIYNSTNSGFRIFLRWSDGRPLSVTDAIEKGWHITWMSMDA